MTSKIVISLYDPKMYKMFKLIDVSDIKKINLYLNVKFPYHIYNIASTILSTHDIDTFEFYNFLIKCAKKCNTINYNLLTLLLEIKYYNDIITGGGIEIKEIDKLLIEGHNDYLGIINPTLQTVNSQPINQQRSSQTNQQPTINQQQESTQTNKQLDNLPSTLQIIQPTNQQQESTQTNQQPTNQQPTNLQTLAIVSRDYCNECVQKCNLTGQKL